MATTAHNDGEPPDPRASTDSQTHLLPPSPSPSPSSPLLPPSPHDLGPLAMPPEDSADQDPAHGLSAEEARRVLRRIDRRVIPLLFLASALTFMDKTILSSAAVFGLRADTGLSGAEYSWVSSAFYLGYLVATYPATRLAARLPVAKYLGANSLFWGVVVALTALCRGFGGVFTARFALGLAEAAVAPCQVFVTGAWFVRDEIPARTGVWFAGNSVGGIVSSLLAFGVGSGVQHGAWRWMFAILGILTFVFGGVVLAFLPDSISTAKFLTHEERKWARDRVVVAGLGATEKKPWRWDQMRECLIDPKTWMVWALALLCQIPNGGTQNFANIVITSFGFSPLQSTLINIPYSVLGFATITGSGWVAGRFRSMNCILIALVVIPPIIGSALISHRTGLPHGVSLFGYFLLSTGPSALPLLLSLVQSNFRGVTKKMTMTALLFIAYCAGNIAGPQLFRGDEAPMYDTAFRGILVCYSLVVGFALALRAYLQAVNRRRQRREGVEGSAGASGAVGGGKVVDVRLDRRMGEAVGEVRLRPEDYEDVTDWNTFGFRYRL